MDINHLQVMGQSSKHPPFLTKRHRGGIVFLQLQDLVDIKGLYRVGIPQMEATQKIDL